MRRLWDQADEAIAVFALLVTVGSVGWGVVTRYVTAQPAVWASEVAAIAFAWLTFFGASACFRHNAHPSIDMLVQRLPADVCTVLLEEGAKAMQEMTRLTKEQEAGFVERFRSAGVQIVTDLDIAAFREASAATYRAFPRWTPGLHETVRRILAA